ncbi:hypothetical protein [Ferrovum sp.]|uniref:hypothetical protein n=1 Tax=Ferrovum sp. TaxID=2609467 RepID=UPI002628E285|nr:hypothetical protein [Ferrovum sp.]
MTPDVNILVAACRQDHPHHERALDWLEEAIASSSGRSLVNLPMAVSGFLRLVTFDKDFRKLLKPGSVTVLKC